MTGFSLRYRDDLHLPLARTLSLVLPSTLAAGTGEASVLLTGTANFRDAPRWLAPRDAAGSLLVGLLLGERRLYGSLRRAPLDGGPRSTSEVESFVPGPLGRQALRCAELALRGRLLPQRLAESLGSSDEDLGSILRAGLERYKTSRDWRDVAAPGSDASGALRSIGLGVLLGGDRATLTVEALASAFLTHRDVRALAGAATLSWAARMSLDRASIPSVSPGDALTSLASYCRSVERVLVRRRGEILAHGSVGCAHDLSDLLFEVAHWMDLPLEESLPRIDEAARRVAIRSDPTPFPEQVTRVLPLGLCISFTRTLTGGSYPFPKFGNDIPDALGALVGALQAPNMGKELPGREALRSNTQLERAFTLGCALAGDPRAL
jgi:hypothetical protein